jgi:glycosyltransferase involved in cell wall biosynthesis
VSVARWAGVRTIFSAAVDRDVEPRRALFRRPQLWPLYWWGLERSDRIFVQHRSQLAGLSARLRGRASLLPGIVELPESVVPHARRAAVAWVAVLRSVKRPDLLIEVARRAPEIAFKACGGRTTFLSPPGFAESAVSALEREPNIDYLGPVAPRATLDVIGSAAVLLSTSDEEGFPATFLEAWAAGTPVVSLKLDPDGLIAGHGLGLVPGSVDRTAGLLKTLVASPELRESMGARARDYVAATHTARSVAALFSRSLPGRDLRQVERYTVASEP